MGEQLEELMVLESIFDKTCLTFNYNKSILNNSNLGTLIVGGTPVDSVARSSLISGDFSANFQLPCSAGITVTDGDRHSVLKHLPPVTIGFQLPAEYPLSKPPLFQLSCKWLSKSHLSSLCHKLDELWLENEGFPILFTWISFLQQDSLGFLGIEIEYDIKKAHAKDRNAPCDERAVQDIGSINILFDYLLDHEKTQLQMEFDRQIWTCEVCFSEKPGRDSLRFHECSHVYCNECMVRHFTVRIDEGDIKGLNCPSDKCTTQAYPHQVKRLLPTDLYDKYERLLLQSTLDSMLDIGYCPRPKCNTPVLLDQNSNMAHCTACNFFFCTLCSMSYHGIHPCNITKSQLQKKLKDATDEDIEGYVERYGQQMVEALLNECASYDWMEKYCESCPVCAMKITKGDGCNKMTCTKCKAYFCWVCKAVLSRHNPYEHFKRSNCVLFPGQNDDFDVEFHEEEEEEEEGLIFLAE